MPRWTNEYELLIDWQFCFCVSVYISRSVNGSKFLLEGCTPLFMDPQLC